MMDLKKIEQFTKRIDVLKERIERIELRIKILNGIKYIEFRGNETADHKSFRISEDSLFNLESSLEVFKVLAIKELNEELEAHEKELDDFIKKGIIEND